MRGYCNLQRLSPAQPPLLIVRLRRLQLSPRGSPWTPDGNRTYHLPNPTPGSSTSEGASWGSAIFSSASNPPGWGQGGPDHVLPHRALDWAMAAVGNNPQLCTDCTAYSRGPGASPSTPWSSAPWRPIVGGMTTPSRVLIGGVSPRRCPCLYCGKAGHIIRVCPVRPKEATLSAQVLDSHSLGKITHCTVPLSLTLSGNHVETIQFLVLHAPTAPLVLGRL